MLAPRVPAGSRGPRRVRVQGSAGIADTSNRPPRLPRWGEPVLDRDNVAWRTAGLYAAVSAAWIFASDRIVILLVPDDTLRHTIHTAKGWAFVALTSALLYGYLSKQMRERDRVRAEAQEREAQLRRAEKARRELMATLATAQADERHRIAEDVHDDQIEALTVVGLRLSLLQRLVDNDEAADRLRELEDAVTATTKRLRGLMFDLEPPEVERHGLAASIQRHLDRHSDTSVIHLDDDASSRVPLADAATAYRSIVEMLNTIRRHAAASALRVSLTERDGWIVATIAHRTIDDGNAPFLADEAVEALRRWAETVGGWCGLRPGTSPGAELELWFPATASPHLVGIA